MHHPPYSPAPSRRVGDAPTPRSAVALDRRAGESRGARGVRAEGRGTGCGHDESGAHEQPAGRETCEDTREGLAALHGRLEPVSVEALAQGRLP